MTKATTFTAIDPTGTVHTRTSKSRTYSHTVVAKPCFHQALARMDTDYAVDGKNWERSGKVSRGEIVYTHIAKETIEKCRQEHALYGSREEAIAGCRASRVAYILQRKADGYYDTYVNLGWCGRLDLAQKLAVKGGGYTGAVILEANVK